MKRRARAQSSTLFLMELIIAILFFAIASAICVRFFVTSHQMSQASSLQNKAVNACSGIAEIIDTSDSGTDLDACLFEQFPDMAEITNSGSSETSVELIFCDDNFSPVAADLASNLIRLELQEGDSMVYADIRAIELKENASAGNDALLSDASLTDSDSMDSVYNLTIEHHFAKETGYGQ